jgi:hypothetical protein
MDKKSKATFRLGTHMPAGGSLDPTRTAILFGCAPGALAFAQLKTTLLFLCQETAISKQEKMEL